MPTSKQPGPAEPVRVDPELDVALKCTYCHDRVQPSEGVYCAACLAVQHAECFDEHGACTALGCSETRVLSPGESTQPRPRWRWFWLSTLLLGLTGAAALALHRPGPAPNPWPARTVSEVMQVGPTVPEPWWALMAPPPTVSCGSLEVSLEGFERIRVSRDSSGSIWVRGLAEGAPPRTLLVSANGHPVQLSDADGTEILDPPEGQVRELEIARTRQP